MKFIYHGTIVSGIDRLEPKKRYTPGGSAVAKTISERIYASYIPAYAIAHSFPWSSKDGFDIEIIDGVINLLVPRDQQSLLTQPICLYKLSDKTFVHTTEDKTGLTYHSVEAVIPFEYQCYDSVTRAMKEFGGTIELVDNNNQ